MQPLASIDSRAVVLALDDIDTDQIIPARFLKTTERRGLGRHLLADWRYAADGTPVADFPLNSPHAKGRRILVGGRNFGCGSSREHAPWALGDFGFECVVASSFADIFRSNALKNGIVPVQVTRDAHIAIVRQLTESPDTELHVDIATCTLSIGDDRWPFPLPPFARHCLLQGVDQFGYLLRAEDEIARYESSHPSFVSTLA